MTPIVGFLVFLFLRIIRAASSQTIFFLWVSLELNIVSVLPLMGAKSSFFSSEIRLKYFISQRIASIFFIFSTLGFLVSTPSIISIIIITSILFKLGIPPFHS